MNRLAPSRSSVTTGLVIALVVLTAAVWFRNREERKSSGIGSDAAVTASSFSNGAALRKVVTSGGGWVTSTAMPVGQWVDLGWSATHTLRRVVLVRGPLSRPGILSGYLTFSDGSQVEVTLSTSSTTTVVPVAARSANEVRFTILSVSTGASAVGLTHVGVFDQRSGGDVATDAPPDGNVVSGAMLSNSAGEAGGKYAGTAVIVSQPVGGQVTLRWSSPRELDAVSVAGAASSALVRSASLVFSDGSRVAVGAVLADPTRPTAVSFMARATSSLVLVVNSVTGSGPVKLAKISAYQVGSPALGVVGASAAAPSGPPTPVCNPSTVRPADGEGLQVQCPVNGSSVGDSVSLRVALGMYYTGLQATVLPAVGTSSPPAVAAVVSAAGIAKLSLDVASLASGPFTVLLEAVSTGKAVKTVLLQLDKSTGTESPTPTGPGGAATGRSLVYGEDFSRPLSASRSGAEADYSASKPLVGMVGDFGEAIFADPASGLGNLQVVDGRYLRISVQPKPADYADPQGQQRKYVGGLLASARPGGSGFSAQFGYFEARMLAPAAPGTWPAFWMLPSPNLVATESAVAEIDAAELYGQFPEGSCQSTHQYIGGKDGGIADCNSTRFPTLHQAMQWHTYGVAVNPTVVTYYIDNKQVATAPQVTGGSDPLFVMVDLALGGGWPIDLTGTQGRADLYVDYVRVYE